VQRDGVASKNQNPAAPVLKLVIVRLVPVVREQIEPTRRCDAARELSEIPIGLDGTKADYRIYQLATERRCRSVS
jgi:hypothetical protein